MPNNGPAKVATANATRRARNAAGVRPVAARVSAAPPCLATTVANIGSNVDALPGLRPQHGDGSRERRADDRGTEPAHPGCAPAGTPLLVRCRPGSHHGRATPRPACPARRSTPRLGVSADSDTARRRRQASSSRRPPARPRQSRPRPTPQVTGVPQPAAGARGRSPRTPRRSRAARGEAATQSELPARPIFAAICSSARAPSA